MDRHLKYIATHGTWSTKSAYQHIPSVGKYTTDASKLIQLVWTCVVFSRLTLWSALVVK